MCYPIFDIKEPEIVAKYPEGDDMEMPDDYYISHISDNLINSLICFRDFINEMVIWLSGMKPSRDKMSISKVMVKMLFDFRHVIKHKMVEEQLKRIYGRVVVNERRYEGIVNDYIKLFEGIRDNMDDKIIQFESCVGDMDRMIELFNEFDEYSQRIVANEYTKSNENIINQNRLHQKTLMSLYEMFIKTLWRVNSFRWK